MRLRTVSQDESVFGSFWRASIRSSSKARSAFVNSTASVTAAILSQISLLAEGSDCPWVFPYKGRRFKSFKTAWTTACRNAGLTARIAHDFRRTAVRNLTRAGIVEGGDAAGHLTRSVFERYNIVSRGDLEHAKAVLDSKTGTTSGTKSLEVS